MATAIKPLASKLKREWSYMLSERSGFEKGWRDLGKYFIPHRSNVNLTVSNGQNQTTELYEGVGVHANELLASSMAGSLTSPAARWFSLKMRNLLLMRKKKVREWLEDAANVVYHELRQSNFHAEAHEGYKDISGLGTMAVFVDSKDKKKGQWQGLKFQSLSIGEYAVSEDAEGRVNKLFRKFKLTRSAVVAMFGVENCSEKTKKLYRLKPDELVDILHCVGPREDGREGAKKATLKPFYSVYMELSESFIVRESGYDEFPFMVARWDKTSGEMYGRGPGHTALPNVKTLNKIQELFLKALAKVISPPMKQRHNGVIGKVRLTPDSLNTVLEMDDLQPIEFGSNFSVTYQEKADLRQEIRHIFFWDQLQLQQGTTMTATEVERRWELMQRLLGPTLGRIENEFLNPLIYRVMQELDRNGRLPQMPPELIQAAQEGNDDLDIVYEGPLARAQRSSEMAALEKTMTMVQALKETFPEIADNFNADAIALFIADATGLSPKLLNDDDTKNKTRGDRQAAAKQQQDTMNEETASNTAKNMAGAMNDLSQPEVQEAAQSMLPQGGAPTQGVPA